MKTNNTENKKTAYLVIHTQHNSSCADSNGSSILASYASEENAIKRFEDFLRTSILNDLQYVYELEDENISVDFDNISLESINDVIKQAIKYKSIRFVNCTVEIRKIEIQD